MNNEIKNRRYLSTGLAIFIVLAALTTISGTTPPEPSTTIKSSTKKTTTHEQRMSQLLATIQLCNDYIDSRSPVQKKRYSSTILQHDILFLEKANKSIYKAQARKWQQQLRAHCPWLPALYGYDISTITYAPMFACLKAILCNNSVYQQIAQIDHSRNVCIVILIPMPKPLYLCIDMQKRQADFFNENNMEKVCKDKRCIKGQLFEIPSAMPTFHKDYTFEHAEDKLYIDFSIELLGKIGRYDTEHAWCLPIVTLIEQATCILNMYCKPYPQADQLKVKVNVFMDLWETLRKGTNQQATKGLQKIASLRSAIGNLTFLMDNKEAVRKLQNRLHQQINQAKKVIHSRISVVIKSFRRYLGDYLNDPKRRSKHHFYGHASILAILPAFFMPTGALRWTSGSFHFWLIVRCDLAPFLNQYLKKANSKASNRARSCFQRIYLLVSPHRKQPNKYSIRKFVEGDNTPLVFRETILYTLMAKTTQSHENDPSTICSRLYVQR